MHVRRRRGWEIPERLAAPESVFLSRREMIAGGIGLLAGMSPARAATDPTADLYPAPRNAKYALDRLITPESTNTHYNNFIEFGAYKDVAGKAAALRTRPWELTFDGMVGKTTVVSIDELVRKFPLEERLYRHRSVEPWSMAVPWTGFPLAALVAYAAPLGSARYLRFEAFHDPSVASGQNSFYPWPYVEGLTMAEATNELAFVVTGAYGKPLAKVMGAPIRIHLPWKYGFKSIKSVVRITFTDERPVSFWQTVGPDAYGFWANVNPSVPHPRWSQASERDLATRQWIPTRIFNGYGEYVAGLYGTVTGEPLYM